VTSGASFNVPEYYGDAKEAALVWVLTRGTKRARCSLWTHPLGAELRVEAAGEFVRSQADRDVLALVELAANWKLQFRDGMAVSYVPLSPPGGTPQILRVFVDELIDPQPCGILGGLSVLQRGRGMPGPDTSQ
jgi:hypothetical protein